MRCAAFPLQAFEDALDSHSHELTLKQDLLERVHSSRESELAALAKMRADVRSNLCVLCSPLAATATAVAATATFACMLCYCRRELEKRLQGRKAELRLQQEKARLRAAKAEHEGMLEGTTNLLTAEDEIRFLERIKAANVDVSRWRPEYAVTVFRASTCFLLARSHPFLQAQESRTVKLRAQAEAEAVESDYNCLRMTAGIPIAVSEGRRRGSFLDTSTITQSLMDGGGGAGSIPEVDEVVPEANTFAEPDANAIVSRFSTLERELKQVRAITASYAAIRWSPTSAGTSWGRFRSPYQVLRFQQPVAPP